MTSIPPPSILVPGQLLDRYELLCPIAQGGMAQVWVARLQGKLGFEKLVAIKTIIAQHAMEERFEKMFLDEARIIAGIRHPNVAQILDLGQHADVLYLVLEWIDGDSAASLRRAVHGKGEKLPLSIALRIVADSCAGLHAAHELRNSSGESLSVVHRDVSPSNVLVSISGEVKIIDFGVAKAVDRVSEETAAGVIKGKVAYMAPEQALGKKIDRRADIWSCGVMLYHLLAGKTPYEAENQIATLHKVVQGLPPEPLRGVPPEVAELAYTALSYAPEGRFSTADEMQRALERILINHCGPVTPSDVASFVHLKLAERVARRKRTIQRALDAAEQRKALAVEFEDAIEQSSSSIYGVGELRTPATMSSVSHPKAAPASVSDILPPSSRPPKSSPPPSAGPLPPVPVTPSSFPPTLPPPPVLKSVAQDPPPLAHALAPLPHDPEATGRVVPVRPMDPEATIPVSRSEPAPLPPIPRLPDFAPKPAAPAPQPMPAPLITVAEDIPPPRPMFDSLVEMRKFGTRRRGPMIIVGMLAAGLLLAYGAYLAWDRVSTEREMSQPPPTSP
jgi:serine/threonine-protein kinase